MFKFALLGLLWWSLGKNLAAAEWQEIQERGFLVVGLQEHNPPLIFKDKQGNLTGFEVELARALAAKLLGNQDKVKFVLLKNKDRLQALWDERVDFLIAQMTVTGNRQRLVDFSPSYYTDRVVIIYPKDKPFQAGQPPKIGVLNQSSNITVLQDNLPQAIPIGLTSYQEGYKALLQNKLDGMILDGVAAANWLQSQPQFSLMPTTQFISLAVALPKGLQYAELRQRTTKAIESLKLEQWLEERAKLWQLNPVK